MQIYRFDVAIAKTLSNGVGNQKLGQLLGASTVEHVSVLLLERASVFTSPPTTSQRLFAVISGSCDIASGGTRFPLMAFHAAVADVGEHFEATATEDVVALSIEGQFDVWAVSVTKDIVVAPYDQSWPERFEALRRQLYVIVGDLALRIDHVGSTSIEGLAAKPIIDIDIVACDESTVQKLIARLESNGYRWRGDLGVTGREAFAPVDPTFEDDYHLYVVVENNRAHLDHLLLRDELRDDGELCAAYGKLKTSNVELANGNMSVYVAAKANFVADVLTRARDKRGLPAVTYWRGD